MAGSGHWTSHKTDPKLLAALREAASRPLTAEETFRQAVSFVMGSLKESSGITREQVERQLASRYGGGKAG